MSESPSTEPAVEAGAQGGISGVETRRGRGGWRERFAVFLVGGGILLLVYLYWSA